MDNDRSIALTSEEAVNAATHGLGVLMSLVAVPILLFLGAEAGDPYKLLGLGVFGVSLFLVYLSSTIYHSMSKPQLKELWHRIDHISIFFLIAGTHTPFLVFFLQHGDGIFYLLLIWGMAFLGMIYKLFFFGRLKMLSLLFYLAMGWIAVFTLPPMIELLPSGTLGWIVAGGVAYTLGVIFFVWERLRYHHAIWHLFVLAGSSAHFVAMLHLV